MVRQQGTVVAVSVLVVLALGIGGAIVPGTAAADDDEVDQDLIDRANEAIQETNENLEAELFPELEETENPPGLEPIEVETTAELEVAYQELNEEIDRLALDMLHAVVHEINANSPIGDIIDPADVTEPDDAREEGDGFVEEYGHLSDRAEEGQEGLYRVADRVEDLHDRFEPVLEDMEVELYGEALVTVVTGTVTDENDEPVAGVEVNGDGETTTTADDGSFEIEIGGSGTTALSFEHDAYATVDESVDLDADSALSLNVQLEADEGTDDDDGADDDGLPGFGVVAALVSMLAAATIALRVHERRA